MNNTPEFAFRKCFHAMRAADMAREGRKMLDARPTCTFSELMAGKTYLYKPTYGTQFSLVAVSNVTPKHTQAIASVNNGNARKIYRGSYGGTFVELDNDLIALSGVNHEMIVKEAISKGLEIPPEVRCEYPGLFVDIPDRFAHGRWTAVERVKQSLNPMMREAVTAADVDKWIEAAYQNIASLRCERTRRVALNPDTAVDYDRSLDDYYNDIDYYRWLRRLVDTDGVFCVQKEKQAVA